MRLSSQYIEGKWWILGVPQSAPGDPDQIGPYDTKAEAAEDRRGLEAFYASLAPKESKPCRQPLQPSSPQSFPAVGLLF